MAAVSSQSSGRGTGVIIKLLHRFAHQQYRFGGANIAVIIQNMGNSTYGNTGRFSHIPDSHPALLIAADAAFCWTMGSLPHDEKDNLLLSGLCYTAIVLTIVYNTPPILLSNIFPLGNNRKYLVQQNTGNENRQNQSGGNIPDCKRKQFQIPAGISAPIGYLPFHHRLVHLMANEDAGQQSGDRKQVIGG